MGDGTVEVKPMNSRLYGGLGTAAQGRTLDGETGEFIGFTPTVFSQNIILNIFCIFQFEVPPGLVTVLSGNLCSDQIIISVFFDFLSCKFRNCPKIERVPLK